MEVTAVLGLGWQAWITVAVIGAILTALLARPLPPDFLFLGGLVLLLIFGIVSPEEAFSGFSSPALLTVGALYIVVAGVQETGGLSWISQRVLGRPKSIRGAQFRLMAPITGLSSFLNNTPVVAMFIPVVTEWGRRIGVPASRLLIPLSYASILGGICTLIGTSTNLVVNGMVAQRFDAGELGMFEITLVGLPCAILGVLYILAFGNRLLVDRRSADEVFENPREYTLDMRVSAGSPLAGKSIGEAGLRRLPGAFLADLERDGQVLSAVSPEEILREHDRLVFVGNLDSIRDLRNTHGLEPSSDQLFKLNAAGHDRRLVEAVVSNTCPLVGKSIREGRFRNRYNAVVVAVARNGERVRGRIGDVVLRPGDTLLVEAHAGFVPRQRDSRDFYLVSNVDGFVARRVEKAPVAVAVLAAMVTVVTVGWMSMTVAALVAAGLMVILRCCSWSRARRSVEWSVLLVIAGALGIGGALESTGAAESVAGLLMEVGQGNPWITLVVVYAATAVFTELITNIGAAVLLFPIAMTAAHQLEVSPMPFIIAVMVAASASFVTPIGYQTNLMVYGPGGYRFSDYARIGLGLSLVVGVTALLLIPQIWPF
jgi:di/tricarboxylate transporter